MSPTDDTPRDGEMEFVHRTEPEGDASPDETTAGQEPAAATGDAATDASVGATFAVKRRHGGPPWVMIGAGVVIVLVAAWIFWPRGNGADITNLGLGENVTVLSSDSTATTSPQPSQPRSSDVNLGLEVTPIVPEKPAGETATSTGATAATTSEQAERPSAEARNEAAATTSQPTHQRPVVTPGPNGKWAIQVGAFGRKVNADKLAQRLRKKGLRVETYRADTGTGSVWKVWIGYFPTREETARWLARHHDAVGMPTYITHR